MKAYFYAAIAVLGLGGFLWYNHHERSIGAAKVVAAVAVVAQKAETQVAAGAATAETTETHDAEVYTQTVTAPPPPNLGIVCHSPARSSPVPEAAPIAAPGAGVTTPVSAEGSDFDPSGAALERAREADAQIAYLQGRVRELEKQMEDSP